MTKKLVAVFDKKIALFDAPFTVRHVGEAIREWEIVKKNPETKFGKNPEDFDLYQIGEFDEMTGSVNMLKPHTHLASGV